jgi:hypothetical protein
LSTLRLIVDASDDIITVRLDTGDTSRLNEALPKIEQANTLIGAAMVRLDTLVAHRGT